MKLCKYAETRTTSSWNWKEFWKLLNPIASFCQLRGVGGQGRTMTFPLSHSSSVTDQSLEPNLILQVWCSFHPTVLDGISVLNCSAAESSVANPFGKLSPFLCQHSFTLLCNHSFAVLKLQQPHLLILTTMGMKFTLSLCVLLKSESALKRAVFEWRPWSADQLWPNKSKRKGFRELRPSPHFLGH